jgi:hypothetical protein
MMTTSWCWGELTGGQATGAHSPGEESGGPASPHPLGAIVGARLEQSLDPAPVHRVEKTMSGSPAGCGTHHVHDLVYRNTEVVRELAGIFARPEALEHIPYPDAAPAEDRLPEGSLRINNHLCPLVDRQTDHFGISVGTIGDQFQVLVHDVAEQKLTVPDNEADRSG